MEKRKEEGVKNLNPEYELKIAEIMKQYKSLKPKEFAEVIELAKSFMDEETLEEFDDVLKIAKARVDKKASIEYWFRDSEKGQKITLTHLQQLALDFIEAAWNLGLIPIVNAPMASGKSSLAVGITADEIGRNQNIRTQIICSSEDGANKRGGLVSRLLLSVEYKKVFPHIEKAKGRPWNTKNINVKRTILDPDLDREIKESGIEPGTIDATMSSFGIDTKALGTRADFALFDDIPNEDNAINYPTEGDKIASKLDTTWISRRETPIGVKNTDYDPTKDPYKALFINTPWSEEDCVFRRIKRDGYATILIGVNADFTGYNVEIWGLPDEQCETLKKRYELIVDEDLLKEDKLDLFHKAGYGLGDVVSGYNVYRDFAAKCVFTIPLCRPAEWYMRIYRQNPRTFDQMYRCIVISDQEKAFPSFQKCLDKQFKVNRTPIYGIDDKGKKVIKGNRGSIPKGIIPKGSIMFASADLSGANRAGTVFVVGCLLPNYKRFIVDMRKGAWSGNEITDQITDIFNDYPEIVTMFVENDAQQDIFIKEALKHQEKYPWWMKIKTFTTTIKNKGDRMLGVLAMDTAFNNRGFIIPDSIGQKGHPVIGEPGSPEGCPCGMCSFIRESKNQLRLGKVASDTIMAVWMFHASMPQTLEIPTLGAPEGWLTANNGQDFSNSLKEEINTENFLNKLWGLDSYDEPQLKKHFREDGSEITEMDNDWKPEWSDQYEVESDFWEEETMSEDEEKIDYNTPQAMRQKPQTNAFKSSWRKF